ncbi:MAG: TolC family protein, partial [Hyphomonadaceae bacterium]|nr:TolC family protein [Hyphomonadaceae bacterium]
MTSPVSAQTLPEAIAMTLQSNPALQVRVSQVEAAGERLVQARGQRRAQAGLEVSASHGAIWTRQRFLSTITAVDQVSNSPVAAGLTLSQPLWSGGRISAATALADAQLRQALAAHAQTESGLIQGVIVAYADLARDLAQLQVRETSVQVLQQQLAAARARFEAGDITLTDVAQVEARLAAGVAAEAQARSRLEASRAAVTRLLGQAPSSLTPEPLALSVPASLDDALSQARRDNPGVVLARLGEEQASAGVRAARASHAPQASVFVQGNTQVNQGFDDNRGGSLVVGTRLSVPLYTAGIGASRTREALAQQTAARHVTTDVVRGVDEQVTTAWWGLMAARSAQTATRQRQAAAALAFEGAQIEQSVGLRTTLDVLVQQQELREAELAVAAAARDVLASSALLAS